MRSVTVSILLAFVAQASATDEAQKSTDDAQQSADKLSDDLIDKMVDRAFDASNLHAEDLKQMLSHVDMDDSTLGKPGQLATRASPVSMSKISAPMHTAFPRRMPSVMAQASQQPTTQLAKIGAAQTAQEPDMEQLKQQLKTALKSMVATGAMSAPLAAQAYERTPSLNNLLNSVVAGGFVAAAIFAAVTAVANFDPVDRK